MMPSESSCRRCRLGYFPAFGDDANFDLKVLHAVGFDKDLLKICADDPLGRLLQDERDNKYAREGQ